MGVQRRWWTSLEDGGVVACALLAVLSALVAGLQAGAGFARAAGLSLLAAVLFGAVGVLRGRRLGR